MLVFSERVPFSLPSSLLFSHDIGMGVMRLFSFLTLQDVFHCFPPPPPRSPRLELLGLGLVELLVETGTPT